MNMKKLHLNLDTKSSGPKTEDDYDKGAVNKNKLFQELMNKINPKKAYQKAAFYENQNKENHPRPRPHSKSGKLYSGAILTDIEPSSMISGSNDVTY